MIVTRPDLEASLARVHAEVRDPRHGIHGPGSVAWQLQREMLMFLGGGRAVLLQLAHPFVAYAIDQHSKTRDDVLGRFQRTFDNVFAMSFGDLDEAFTAARRVHNIHTRIHGALPDGTRYDANDAESLRWVYATLVHTVVHVRELVLGPLPRQVRDDYTRETWRFARLFGIPDALLPATWAHLDRYVEAMMASPTLTVSPPAREMSRFLFGGAKRPPAGRWLELMTTGMLPARLQRQFGLAWGIKERLGFASSIVTLRPAYRLAPSAIRHVPTYQNAERRIRGLPPSRATKWMEQRLQLLAQLATG